MRNERLLSLSLLTALVACGSTTDASHGGTQEAAAATAPAATAPAATAPAATASAAAPAPAATAPAPEAAGSGLYALDATALDGGAMPLSMLQGKVTVFVNVSTMRNIVKNDAEDYQKYTIKDKGEEKEKHVFNAVPFTVTQNDDGTETQTPAWSREVEIDIEDATVAAQLAGKWQGEQLKRLLPRSAAPPPDNDRPSASWY